MAGNKEREFDDEGWRRLETKIVSISQFAKELHGELGISEDAARKRLTDSKSKGRFTGKTKADIAQTLGISVEELMKLVQGDRHPNTSDPRSRYLDYVIREHAALRLKAIDPNAMKPGSDPLQLSSVYVDLNLTFQKFEDSSLQETLRVMKEIKDDHELIHNQEGDPVEKARLKRELQAEFMEATGKPLSEMQVARQAPTPAMEAAGLHDRLVLLGPPGSGKSTITSMLALTLADACRQAEDQQRGVLERLGEWWQAGPLVPVRVILRQFGASLPANIKRGRAKHLWEFIEHDLTEALSAKVAGVPREAAHGEGAMFLFDGLDEVRDEATRARMLEAVAEFAKSVGSNCRFLVTARPYAWEAFKDAQGTETTPAEIADMHAAYTLADFDPTQIETFIEQWYRAIRRADWPVSEIAGKQEELKNAVQREDLKALAANPLLLTLMATLHSNRGRLPDDRAELYHEVVELLLQRWNEQSGADRGLLDALAIPSLRMDHLRQKLEALAWLVHSQNVGEAGVADIPEGALINALRPLLHDGSKVDLALDYIEKRAGLLLDQGERDGQRQYSFPHRTFQEYLAARHLAGGRLDMRKEAVNCAKQNPQHWREVLILAARCAGSGHGVPVADSLVRHVDVTAHGLDRVVENDWRRAMLAAEQLLEIGQAQIESEPDDAFILRRVGGWLAALLDKGALPVAERAQAGRLLARLGDPRPGVGLDADGLPCFDWIDIPAGDFLMGDEKRKETIPESYRISRYPVTVAQYEAFITAGGYETEDFWSPEGWKWKGKRLQPENYEDAFQTANHPRVGVSWYEADAFCCWLAERTGLPIGLPSEAQWERAARHTDGRTFPWGNDEAVANRCNSKRQIDSTAPVGMFPTGNAVCQARDMAGNVWEWCNDVVENARVLRGGSWGDDPRDGFRCDLCVPYVADSRGNIIGFRVVVAVEAQAVAS